MFSFVEYIPVPYALVAAWKPCVYSPHNLTKEVQEWDNLYLRGTRSFLKKQRPFKGLDEEDTYETKAQALKLRIERKKATRGVGRYIPRALSEEDRVQELRKRAKDELDLYMAGSIASIDQKLDELIAKTDTNGLYGTNHFAHVKTKI
ncbi:unnamed protein product [Rhizoctonia solani]|uniref:Uncharacterized protein n=1 Tax=Rhizoctonia solani TaxID=456999 RepID=A0A8H2X108_9AGAM|nr:unnamed protein product [Rhizoctonia solani]